MIYLCYMITLSVCENGPRNSGPPGYAVVGSKRQLQWSSLGVLPSRPSSPCLLLSTSLIVLVRHIGRETPQHNHLFRGQEYGRKDANARNLLWERDWAYLRAGQSVPGLTTRRGKDAFSGPVAWGGSDRDIFDLVMCLAGTCSK